ncbi:MAG: uracil-DNA glycosylase [Bacilli bacterium]
MINKKWDDVLCLEFDKAYFRNLVAVVKKSYENDIVYPAYNDIFKALKETDYDEVKVVILGQDPYHGEGEAHGLCFSVLDGVTCPPSLKNILKELYNDIGIMKKSTDLTCWAKQGVLLLNCIMTVVKNKPLAHKNIGFEIFTDRIISLLNERSKPIVFILWGNYAKSKELLITNKCHFIITSSHPSPFSAHRGFLGSKPFSRTNDFLAKKNIEKIKW